MRTVSRCPSSTRTASVEVVIHNAASRASTKRSVSIAKSSEPGARSSAPGASWKNPPLAASSTPSPRRVSAFTAPGVSAIDSVENSAPLFCRTNAPSSTVTSPDCNQSAEGLLHAPGLVRAGRGRSIGAPTATVIAGTSSGGGVTWIAPVQAASRNDERRRGRMAPGPFRKPGASA